jgi:hypothetical protein
VWRLRRARAADLGQRPLHDADEQIAPGGAAEALQVCGVGSLAGLEQPDVQLRSAEQVLRQTGLRSARGQAAGAAGTAARGGAHRGGKCDMEVAQARCRGCPSAARRQGCWSAGEPQEHR